jgi:putative DNA primase/helicase
VARLTIEESVSRTRVANARRFGMEDTVRAETEAHVNLRADLSTARNRLRAAQTHLRTTETQSRRTANLTNADPRVIQQMMLDPRTGTPRSSLANVEAVLRGDADYPAGYFRYDSFAEKLYYRGAPAEDHLDTRINIDIERRYNIAPRTATVQESIVTIAKEDAFHPLRDYLSEHTWDGVSRLGDLFKVGFGATGDAGYLEDAATKFCIGAVARIFEPGCKMDNMIVITGAQGIGKSTAFNVLAKGWFADSPLSIGDKDAFMQMAGKWFYELSELDSFRKAENTRIKAFLSSRFDTFRPPFGRHVVERPRQTVIVGTTNEDQFLNDPTGSRRFVPVRATSVDIAWITANRDQLWAEAVVRYRAGEVWYYAGDDAARLARESTPFQQADVWEPSVYSYVARMKNPTLHVLDVLTGGLGLDMTRITRADKLRVLHVLKGFGCTVVEDTAHKGMTVTIPDVLLKAPAPKTTNPMPTTLPSVPTWVSSKPSTETH